MKIQYLVFTAVITVLMLTVFAGFSQDTSKLAAGKHLKTNSDTLNSINDPNKGSANPQQARALRMLP